MANGLLNPEEIVTMWEEDSKVDSFNVKGELLRLGNVYSKYLDMWMRYRALKIFRQRKFEEMERDAVDWFSGRISVNGKYYPHKLTSEEMRIHRKANEIVAKAQSDLDAADLAIDVLSRILDQVKQKSFDLRAVTGLMKMEAGD
jgi:Recombination, repair and ssDNA binding protein UvsY